MGTVAAERIIVRADNRRCDSDAARPRWCTHRPERREPTQRQVVPGGTSCSGNGVLAERRELLQAMTVVSCDSATRCPAYRGCERLRVLSGPPSRLWVFPDSRSKEGSDVFAR